MSSLGPYFPLGFLHCGRKEKEETDMDSWRALLSKHAGFRLVRTHDNRTTVLL